MIMTAKTRERATIIKEFGELTAAELYEIMKARFKVFVMEQRCWYLDFDDIDYACVHIFICEGTEVIAYARLFAEEEEGVWHIGRVLSTRRGEGLGRDVMTRTMEEARRRGAKTLRLDSQSYAAGFYERLGFCVCSAEFEEAGIMHVRMDLKTG